MSRSKRTGLLLWLAASTAFGHVVSTSTGELRIDGRTATYELRIPAYEVEHTIEPETALLNEVRFGRARRTDSSCSADGDWFVCRAMYEFDQEVTETVTVDCTLYRATVPNHIHLLYAALGGNIDQQVFDQNTSTAELRFHPPSLWESLRRDGAEGAMRFLRSISGWLFVAAIALAARSRREALGLGAMFLAAEWAVRPVAPFIPIAMSPEFTEALLALTVVYLTGELVLLPGSKARWVVVPVFGLLHGLPFTPFPALYLVGANVVQAALLAACAIVAQRNRARAEKPVAAALLGAAALWFVFLVFT